LVLAFLDVIKLAKKSVIKGDALANKTLVWTSYGMLNDSHNATSLQFAPIKPIKSKACQAIFYPGPYFVKVPQSAMCMEVSVDNGMCSVIDEIIKILNCCQR